MFNKPLFSKSINLSGYTIQFNNEDFKELDSNTNITYEIVEIKKTYNGAKEVFSELPYFISFDKDNRMFSILSNTEYGDYTITIRGIDGNGRKEIKDGNFVILKLEKQLETGSQISFQLEDIGEGYEIDEVNRINGNEVVNFGKNLPDWLFFDNKSRIFKGKVPQSEKGIKYEIIIKASSGISEIKNNLLIDIYQNTGIIELKIVGSIDTYDARGISVY